MNVAFDTNALYNSRAGVARYVRGLLGGLQEVAAPDLTLHSLAWEVENLTYGRVQRGLRTFWREYPWARFSAPRRLRKLKADIYHATGTVYFVPPPDIKFVATVHDLAAVRHPERFRIWQRNQLKVRVRRLLLADRFLCISRFTADELMALFDVAASKIEVVYNGVDDLTRINPENRLPADLNLPDEFLLFVGSLEPGKNLRLLRQVYELAKARGTVLPPLLIVGARWPGVAAEGEAPEGWRYLGRVGDETLAVLYRRARALLFPSKYEGFGLPVAEAMTLGCPVICSRVASLAEVGGEAAWYAGQTPEAYLAAIGSLLGDVPRRDSMIAAGREQAAKFSWTKCAQGCLEAYRQLSA
jgi:glycosyltransferase involved in cell wall biosynthesis